MEARVEQQKASISQLLESPAPFRAWLQSFHSNEPIGLTDSNEYCPIACFINIEANVRVLVTPRHILLSKERTSNGVLDLTEWSIKFVAKLDAIGEKGSTKVVAQTALDVLDAVTKKQPSFSL